MAFFSSVNSSCWLLPHLFLVMSAVRVTLSKNCILVQKFSVLSVLLLRRKAPPTQTKLRVEYSHLVNEAIHMIPVECHPEHIPEDLITPVPTDAQARPWCAWVYLFLRCTITSWEWRFIGKAHAYGAIRWGRRSRPLADTVFYNASYNFLISAEYWRPWRCEGHVLWSKNHPDARGRPERLQKWTRKQHIDSSMYHRAALSPNSLIC